MVAHSGGCIGQGCCFWRGPPRHQRGRMRSKARNSTRPLQLGAPGTHHLGELEPTDLYGVTSGRERGSQSSRACSRS
jgi:hypothetical protein